MQRDQLEPLDIKYIAEYDMSLTTHVVAKKRNTSKGLQALINGKYIVNDTFTAAIIEAAKEPDGGQNFELSPLERDFDGNWPRALDHLPPRGEEPSDRPASAYSPDERRRDIFDGYTFIFYDQKQYENLFPPITSGKGKALLKDVVPGETEVDDFVRYVKEVAGEKGLGEFEDGSEGKGVVVVKFVPAKGDHIEWFIDFSTTVSLRLDQRLVNQKEFLEIILAVEPGMLRRPLEVESQPGPMRSQHSRPTGQSSAAMDVDEAPDEATEAHPEATVEETPPHPPARRGRARRAPPSRFKGFDVDLDPDKESGTPQSQGMFVSQDPTSQDIGQETGIGARSQRKRPAPPMIGDDLMEDIAPTAAAVKRRRIAAGEDPVPRQPSPEPEQEEEAADPESVPEDAGKKSQPSKKKDQDEILLKARQRREEAEEREAAERERLEELPEGGLDFEEIRRLTIVEEMEVRQPGAAGRTREQDIADGRWDPRWNGRRNFKRFRKQGDPTGRPVQRVIVGLEPVKIKEYGIGDDYWLEDSGSQKKKKSDSARPSQSASQPAENETPVLARERGKARAPPAAILLDSDSDDSLPDQVAVEETPLPQPEPELPRSRQGKAAEKANSRQTQIHTQMQTQTRSQRTGKRPAAAPPAKEKPAKRPRNVIELQDSDDSDGELKFRFGRR